MSRKEIHEFCMQALMMHNISEKELLGCLENLISMSEQDDLEKIISHKRKIQKNLKNIEKNLEQIDTYVILSLEEKNRDFKMLGSPEKSAIRYGFWLLLGPKKLDPPLCSKIAADLVDVFAESNARALVQGCISWASKNQKGSTLLF